MTPITAFEFIILSLAISRLTYLITNERGFMRVGTSWRRLFGIVEIDGSKEHTARVGSFRRELAEAFSCQYCTSLWLALFTAAAIAIARDVQIVDACILWLSLGRGAMIASRFG